MFKCLAITGCFLVTAQIASSGPVVTVAADTSSLAGDGAIYFQFNPGLFDTDAASVRIRNFSLPGGFLVGTPSTMGDVTGELPGVVKISNTEGLNDYLHFLTFGSEIRFQLEFLLAPAQKGTSGSVLAFGTTGPDGLVPVLTSDPTGFSAFVEYDANAQFKAWSTTDLVEVTMSVPEPKSIFLVILAVVSALLTLAFKRIADKDNVLRQSGSSDK